MPLALTPEEIETARRNVYRAARMLEDRTGASWDAARDAVLDAVSPEEEVAK